MEPRQETRVRKLADGIAYSVAAAKLVVDFDSDIHPWARDVLGALRLALLYTMRNIADDIAGSGIEEALEIIRRDMKGKETEGDTK